MTLAIFNMSGNTPEDMQLLNRRAKIGEIRFLKRRRTRGDISDDLFGLSLDIIESISLLSIS